ncbi:MAG: NADH-quinone oxidoreductase subunit NuoE [Magnetococcus sp. WYHC-3]
MAKRDIMKDPHGTKPEFTPADLAEIQRIIQRYPAEHKTSALMPVLHLAQKSFGGWLSQEALDLVARVLGLAPVRVYEVASFYTMYNLHPVGRYHVQICTNISCWLCGSDEVMGAVQKRLGVDVGHTTDDGRYSLSEVECLGACVAAPMMQINDDYYENLTGTAAVAVLDRLP